MRYRVQARLKPDAGNAFYVKLTDGSVEQQKPDGKEILASMRRAVVQDDGLIVWNETCYCTPPLRHERETVYDSFFVEMSTEPVAEDAAEPAGPLFWTRLQHDHGKTVSPKEP